MKKLTAFLCLLIVLGCGDTAVEKPERLIDEEVMIDILYDLAILDAMRTQKPLSLTMNNIDPDKYIYKKYKIDSLQFAQSNRYYASEIKSYKKMYERVQKRLQNQSEALDPSLKKPAVTEEALSTGATRAR